MSLTVKELRARMVIDLIEKIRAIDETLLLPYSKSLYDLSAQKKLEVKLIRVALNRFLTVFEPVAQAIQKKLCAISYDPIMRMPTIREPEVEIVNTGRKSPMLVD